MASPAPIFCEEVQRLKDSYRNAVSDYLRMQTAHMDAIMTDSADTFTEWVNAARQQMERAKYAVLEHRQQHGCGRED